MASSLARFRDQNQPTPQKVDCPWEEEYKDQTMKEKFPIFTKDLYMAIFPAPVPDRRKGDDKATDHSYFLKKLDVMGVSRLGETCRVKRRDFTFYPCTKVPKENYDMVVTLTKMDSSKVDYVDAVRAIEPFVIRAKHMCPFVAKIYLSFSSNIPFQKEYYYFVSEYWNPTGSLCHQLKKRGCFDDFTCRFYIMQFFEAIMWIHSHNKIMRRLSLCNLLLNPEGYLKLCPYVLCEQNLDCGQACNPINKSCGDQFYASPEVVFGVDVQPVADYWSGGAMLYHMMFGKPPYQGSTLGELGKAITEEALNLPENLDPDTVDVFKRLLQKDPRRRLGFGKTGSQDLMAHPYFQKLRWLDIQSCAHEPTFHPKSQNIF